MSKPVKYINQTPTESNLKSSLLDLLYEKPIEKISVKELCERANIYRSTFYSHYKSPEALLEAIENEVIEQINSYIISGALGRKTGSLHESAVDFLDYIKEHDHTLRVLLFTPQSKTYFFVAHAIEEQFRYITKNYYKLQSEEYTPLFMSHGLLACILHWMHTDYAAPADQLAELLVHTLHSINAIRKEQN